MKIIPETKVLAQINRDLPIFAIASLRLINEVCAPLTRTLAEVNRVGSKIAKSVPWTVSGNA